MPHISMKILSVLSDDQKRTVANKMAEALREVIDCQMDHISVSIEEYGIEQINTEHASVILKMLEGRTEEQKQDAAQKLAETFYKETGLTGSVNVAVGDFTPEEWQDVYDEDIRGRDSILFKRPDYNPKDLLK